MSSPRPTKPLPRLFALRWIEVCCQVLVLWGAQRLLDIGAVQLRALAAIVAALAAFNLLSWWRLRRLWPVTDLEIFGQICADVLALAGLLYFAGGSANPFVSLFLLPLTITAAILPPVYAWVMAGLTLGGYTALLFVSVPLPPLRVDLPFIDSLIGATLGHPDAAAAHVGHAGHGGPDSGFALHLAGMWFNFLVSAGIIAFFLARLAASLRERQRELAAAREEALRHEQILALGTLAAGAAHQLGTPLATMAVVLRDLELEYHDDPPLREDLVLLRRQVDSCKDLLGRLTSAAGGARAADAGVRPIDDYLREVVDKWQLLRPRARLSTDWRGSAPAPAVQAEPTLEQALLNLLDNAADVSPDDIVMEARWDEAQCAIDILDRGPGISGAAAQQIGQPFFTTKRRQGGLGIGLFLSNATLERLGGRVELFNRPGGGACTRVTLPFARLAHETP